VLTGVERGSGARVIADHPFDEIHISPRLTAAAVTDADARRAVSVIVRLEEVWVPAQDEPIIFPRTSEALYLLQRLRDEAHRFAITYHRAKRSKSMTVSALDNVAGLGDVRRKALIRHFGSVAALRRADVEEVLAVPGLGRRTAEAVVAALAGAPTGAAAPARTGPPTPGQQPPADQTRPSRTATKANPIPSTGTQDNAAPVNGIGDGVRGGA